MQWHLAEVSMGLIVLFLAWRILMPSIHRAKLKATKDRITVIFLTLSIMTVGWVWALVFNTIKDRL